MMKMSNRAFWMIGAAVVVLVMLAHALVRRYEAAHQVSELAVRLDRFEAVVAALQNNHRLQADELRDLAGRFSEAFNDRGKEGLPAARGEAIAEDRQRGGRPDGQAVNAAHRQWVANEYPKIVEKNQANARLMVHVIDSETSISKDKLVAMGNIFVEASTRIADILASAQDMSDTRAINEKISGVNRWRDGTLSTLLSKEEFEQYRSINWAKRLRSAAGGNPP